MQYILNVIHRPNRILYYLPAEENDYDKVIFSGGVPECFEKYENAFGAYSDAGIFITPHDRNKMVGIEFRINDDRIDYPDQFMKKELQAEYMLVVEVTSDYDLSYDAIRELLDCVKKENFAHWIKYKMQENPSIVETFMRNNKWYVMIPVDIISSTTLVKSGNIDAMNKEELYYQIYHDQITGHFNWTYMNSYLIEYPKAGINDFIFIHFDVKDFKMINEIYGHNIANNLLAKIARKLNELDWAYVTCRCHNDNFAIMAKDMPQDQIYQKLIEFFNQMSCLDEDREYPIYFRCGVANVKTGLAMGNRVADCAKMAQALGVKHNETEILFHTNEMQDSVIWGKKIKVYLDTAIANDELLVYLQPKYDVNSEKIIGAEALVRWYYHKKEFLSPIKFIPYFEKDGSIGKVDDIVLKKVCENLKKWKEQGLPLYPISVNLSRKRIERKDLIEHLCGIVDSYGIDHSLIDFELTESAVYNNQKYMLDILSQLKDRGFRISMDDFGTGYSSLSLLTEMNLDTLKIDKSFVDGLDNDKGTHQDEIVVKHIISMAKDLNFQCIAEGVEDANQVSKLKSMGCDTIQGYYYCRPIPITEYEDKIRCQ